MPDFHETLARVARESPRIELGTVQICVLVAMRLLTEDEVLPELDEERLSDLYVRVVEVIEGGSRLPRKKATHGLELLRQQGLVSRVDGAGLVRCGAFSLTRLGSAIAESWIEDESLTRQSLVLLTTALRFKLGELLSDAQAAQVAEHWEQIRQKLAGLAPQVATAMEKLTAALSDREEKDAQAGPSVMRWSALRDRCQNLGLLDAALADASLEEVEGKASIDVFQLRQRWWALMLERLDHAADGKGLAEALRLIETADEAGSEQFLRAWLDARTWLAQRVPKHVCDLAQAL